MFNPQHVAGEGIGPSPIRLRALSLGAGVQSTIMARMAAHGEIGPMPDCAIFADTGWEPKAVYDHLDWLMSPSVLPFPIHIVSAGNIRDQLLGAGQGNRWASVPAFTRTVTPAGTEMPVFDEDADGEVIAIGTRRTTKETVSIGMIRRQCTTEFKIVPIRRKVRELAGLTRGWSHGISRDGELLAVVATDTLIRERVAGLSRHDAIELSRICAVEPGLCRVALRLWRMFVFPGLCAERGCRWAVSYQDAALHKGDLYRFDGWIRIGQSRSGTDPRSGRPGRRKVIWGWCDDPEERRRRSRGLADQPERLGLTAGAGRLAHFPFSIGER